MSKTSTAPLLLCIKELLIDRKYLSPLNFQTAQRIYAHPVSYKKKSRTEARVYFLTNPSINMVFEDPV